MRKRDKSQQSADKLSYYSIRKHKALLWLYALLTLALSVAFFIGLIRLLFWVFTFFPILNIGTEAEPDYTYLADFLGGLIGVVAGFIGDSVFISRLQHLRRYKSLLNLLNIELNDVRNTIKKIWGVGAITGNPQIKNVLKAANIINDNDEVVFDNVEITTQKLIRYDVKDKAFYDRLFDALKKVFTNPKLLNGIRRTVKQLELNEEVKIYELRAYFENTKKGPYDKKYLRSALSYCCKIGRITKLSVPVLENIVNSGDEIAIFYNLPRYTFWSEEQGNFARELQFIFHTIENFEENHKTRPSWEFLPICMDLLGRINHFQNVSDKQYYQSDVIDFLKDFVYALASAPKSPDYRKITDDDKLIKELVGKEYSGIKIEKIKKKKFIDKHPRIAAFIPLHPFLRPAINKNYIRYTVVLSDANAKGKKTGGTVKYGNIVLPSKITVKFEKEKFLSSDVAEPTLLYLLEKADDIFDTQSPLIMVSASDTPGEAQKQPPNAFSFSSKFFSSNVKSFLAEKCGVSTIRGLEYNLIKWSDIIPAVNANLKNFSKIFKDITTVPPVGGPDAPRYIKTKIVGILNTLDEDLHEGIETLIAKNRKKGLILKINGPIGSYKNRLLQYVCLKLQSVNINSNVFYIDVSKYENDFDIGAITDDFEKIKEIIDLHKDSNKEKPLFFIDNVREFHCGINHIYTQICSFLENDVKDYRLILGCDILYTLNSEQKEKSAFHDLKKLAPGEMDDTPVINISPMNIARTEECIEFIQNCSIVCGGPSDRETATAIRAELFRLNFYTLDAYWLIKVLKRTDYLKNYSKDILTLYDIGLLKYTPEMDKKQYDDLAKSVYAFEYENQHFNYSELCNNNWTLAREHRSMIDYLVARHYITLLRETILPQNEYTVIRNLGGRLNLFLPKSVNRFVTCELSNNDVYNLILFCDRNIDLINNYPKFECQVSYILRVLGERYLTASVNLLNKMEKRLNDGLNQSMSGDNSNRTMSDAETRQNLFLSRCIAIALGSLGVEKKFLDYIKTIVYTSEKTYNPMADDVNRAFHLDYYGDTYKCLDLTGSFEGYEDKDTTRGVNTFRKLRMDISGGIASAKEQKAIKPILILQMVTYCSLLKTRKYKFKSLANNEDFIGTLKSIYNFPAEVKKRDKDNDWFDRNKYIVKYFNEIYGNAPKNKGDVS
ncbi:MAG: hypothetical protein J1F39_02875 [Clostridiales bacterium]|nr:hypothetical protein [Clostridiales bacterium]